MENTCKEQLYTLIEQGQLETALAYINQNIKEHQNEEYFVLFYILLNIWSEERQANISDIFSSPLGREPEQLLNHYTQIKLYLRRFEYQMPEDILQEAFDYFIQNKVSPQAIYRIAQFACIRSELAFLKLATLYKKCGNTEIAALFYQAAKTDGTP